MPPFAKLEFSDLENSEDRMDRFACNRTDDSLQKQNLVACTLPGHYLENLPNRYQFPPTD